MARLADIEIVAVSDCYIMAVCLYSIGCCRGNVSHHLHYTAQPTASVTFLLNLFFAGSWKTCLMSERGGQCEGAFRDFRIFTQILIFMAGFPC